MLSEEDLRAASVACFRNAQHLYAEAKLLVDHERYARAAALAVIGNEEFAKAIVYTVAAVLPKQRRLLPAKLDGHELQSRIGDAAEGAQIVSREMWAAATDYPSTRATCLTDMLVSLASPGLASLLDQTEAKQYFKEARLRHEEYRRQGTHLRSHPDRDLSLLLREPDLKNAALYVDVDIGGKVLAPDDRVGRRSAEWVIAGLEWFLEEYADIPSTVEDDNAWRAFSDEVRRRVPD